MDVGNERPRRISVTYGTEHGVQPSLADNKWLKTHNFIQKKLVWPHGDRPGLKHG